ncbi:MAG TPA: hypothetical protein VF335_02470, partial [Chitinivibrionales bacterium]
MQWETEKKRIDGLSGLREKIETAKYELEKAERNYDLNTAAKLQHGLIPQLEAKLREAEEALKINDTGTRLLREEVQEEDIAAIVSRWTHIPVSRLVESEKEKLLHLPQLLHRRVIGQDEAVDAVADAVMRARAGLKDRER